MRHLESKLTPAQAALLHFCSHREAGAIVHHLSLTIETCIGNFRHAAERDDPESAPNAPMLDAWVASLQLLRHLQALTTERPAGGS